MARHAQPPAVITGKDKLKQSLAMNSSNLAKAIPAGTGLSADRVIAGTLLAYAMSPMIQKCTIASIFQSVLSAAQMGLDPSGSMGQAYLVPFWNNKEGVNECKLIVGYQGMITLARRSGDIVSIDAQVVHENDEFIYELGLDPKLVHKPMMAGRDARGGIICAYAVAHLVGGGSQFEVMTFSDLEDARLASQTGKKDFGPWVDHYREMCRKTVIRRLFKYLPKSSHLVRAMENDDHVEGFSDIDIGAAMSQNGNVVDATSQPVIDAPPPNGSTPPPNRTPPDDFMPPMDPDGHPEPGSGG